MPSVRIVVSLLVPSMLLSVGMPAASAVTGNLDPTFGGDGIATVSFRHPAEARAMALQTDARWCSPATHTRVSSRSHVSTTVAFDGSGRAVVGGSVYPGKHIYPAAARYSAA